MTPEHNDALHRVQRAHPDVRWVEEDGSVILYREESKRFIYLVLGGSLIEEDAMAALAELDAEILAQKMAKIEEAEARIAAEELEEAGGPVDVRVDGIVLVARPAVAAPGPVVVDMPKKARAKKARE